MLNKLPKVTLIGRVNVGKSTLFNKMTDSRHAMMSDIPGTTRDLNIGISEWQGTQFELIDTGGFIVSPKTKKQKINLRDQVEAQVYKMTTKAFKQSDLILFLVDAKEGLNPQDKEIAKFIKKTNKQCLLVINKCDNPRLREQTAEFYSLGLGEPVMVSAANGSGTGDLLDTIVSLIPKQIKPESVQDNISLDKIHVSIIGKPNAGKSSLVNKLVGEEKFIVSSEAHTTREPNDTLLEYGGHEIILVDTAGIRKKAKIDPKSLEKLGVMMTLASLKKSDLILFVIDIAEGISDQDAKIAEEMTKSGVGVIIIANKYDLIKNIRSDADANSKLFKNPTKFLTEQIYAHLPHLNFAPIVFTSALTGSNVHKILDLIIEVNNNRHIRVNENALGKFLKNIIKKQPPPKLRTEKRRAFITNFEQVGICPPTFVGFVTTKEEVPQSYRRYIEKSLRVKFGFMGTPIQLVIKHE